MKDIGKKSFSAAIYGVFDLGDQPKDDIPADVIERLLSVQPALADKIEKGKTKIDFDSEVKGEDSVHRFDAVVSDGRQLALVKYYRDTKETDVEDLTRLRDAVLDVHAETRYRRIQLVVVSNEFAPGGSHFSNDAKNWNSGKREISRILVRLSGSSYQVISSSDESNYSDDITDFAVSDRDNKISIPSKIRFINSRSKVVVAITIVIIAVLSSTAYFIVSQYGGPSGESGTRVILTTFGSNETTWIFTIMMVGGGEIYKSEVYVQVMNQFGNINITTTGLLNTSGIKGFYFIPHYGTNEQRLFAGDSFCLSRATSTSGYGSGSKIYLFSSTDDHYSFAVLTVPELSEQTPGPSQNVTASG